MLKMLHVWTLLLVNLLNVVSLPTDFSDSKFGFNDGFNDSKWYRDLDLIHGSSRRYKVNDIIDNPVFLLDRLSSSDGARSLPHCHRKAICQTLNYTTCLGAKLPYNKTTLDLVPSLVSQEQIMVRTK